MEHLWNIDKRLLRSGLYGLNTGIGFFLPSLLEHLDIGLQQLIGEETIDPKAWFCDAGAGDGRVLALTAGKHNIPSIGVEYHPAVASLAHQNIKGLELASVINGTPAKVVCGDFMDDEVYRRAGIEFEDIRTFYNYLDNQDTIARKIAERSGEGASFILYRLTDETQEFDGLKLERALEVVSGKYSRMLGLRPEKIHLHVYRK